MALVISLERRFQLLKAFLIKNKQNKQKMKTKLKFLKNLYDSVLRTDNTIEFVKKDHTIDNITVVTEITTDHYFNDGTDVTVGIKKVVEEVTENILVENLYTNTIAPVRSIPFNSPAAQENTNIVYGCATGGGLGYGCLFEYNYDNSFYKVLLMFTELIGEHPGNSPSHPILASNGKLYGLTKLGGANNVGVLYEYDILTSTYTKKLDFSSTTLGSQPNYNMIQTDTNILYGVTRFGGTNNLGTIFEYNYNTNTFIKKYDAVFL